MNEFKAWVTHHKGLAIGGAIGLVVILYLLLKSGGSSQQGTDPTLAAYYAAEAASSGDAAGQTVATNELAASTNQTEAAAGVDTSGINAQLTAVDNALEAQDYSQYLTDFAALSQPGQSQQPNFTDEYVLNQVTANATAAGSPPSAGWEAVAQNISAAFDAQRAADVTAYNSGQLTNANFGPIPMLGSSTPSTAPSLPPPPTFGGASA